MTSKHNMDNKLFFRWQNILILLFLWLVLSFTKCYAGGENFYIYNDLNGCVKSIVNSQQNVIADYAYDSFGGLKDKNVSIKNVYKYNGEQNDEETQLIYLRNRYYDPIIGRFITKDRFPGIISEPGSINSYIYVDNNPINFIDPLGLVHWVRLGKATLGAVINVLGIGTAIGLVCTPEPTVSKVAGVTMAVANTYGIYLNYLEMSAALREQAGPASSSAWGMGGYTVSSLLGANDAQARTTAKFIDLGTAYYNFNTAIDKIGDLSVSLGEPLLKMGIRKIIAVNVTPSRDDILRQYEKIKEQIAETHPQDAKKKHWVLKPKLNICCI